MPGRPRTVHGMASALERVYVVGQQSVVNVYASSDVGAYLSARCGHCDSEQFVVVARVLESSQPTAVWSTQWLRCVKCRRGSVLEGDVVYPTSRPLRVPRGLPPIDLAVWEEARACLGVGANAAAVMLCRKLLFHIAVAHGLEPKKKNDRAPSFYEAVEHLEAEGLITKKMRPWVDRIKDVGNDANHELTPITAAQALDVANFTEQLLVLAYELDALMAAPELESGHDVDS